MDSYNDVRERLITLVRQKCLIDVSAEMRLPIDSFQLVELLCSIEEAFFVRFEPDDVKEIASLLSIQGIATVLYEKVAGKLK